MSKKIIICMMAVLLFALTLSIKDNKDIWEYRTVASEAEERSSESGLNPIFNLPDSGMNVNAIKKIDVSLLYENALYLKELDKMAEGEEWEWLIKPGMYESIELIGNGFICIEDHSGNYAVMDENLDLVLDFQPLRILEEDENCFWAYDGEYDLLLDHEGKLITEEKYDFSYTFKDGLAAVKIGDKWGYIDQEGNMVIKLNYDNARDFHQGLAAVEIDGKWGYIDQKGKMVIAAEYEKADIFSEGLAAVQKDGKWGFIDKDGNMVIEAKFEEAGHFSEDLAAVCLREYEGYDALYPWKERWGYVDKTGEFVMEFPGYNPSPSEVGSIWLPEAFGDGYALVPISVRWLVNKEGEFLIEEEGPSISGRLDKDVLVIYEYADLEMLTDKRFGLMDMEENVILPCLFTNIFMQDNLVTVSINEKGRMDGLILLKGR